MSSPTVLYLIEILHQTTTIEDSFLFCYTLYLIEILHQTTTSLSPPSAFVSCILSKFYIKPQRPDCLPHRVCVVSYRNSTSNHNLLPVRPFLLRLYLIEILHQTTTRSTQKRRKCKLYLIEILHQTTTSSCLCRKTALLYLIEILHQTTTLKMIVVGHNLLYLIEILHQTTTW